MRQTKLAIRQLLGARQYSRAYIVSYRIVLKHCQSSMLKIPVTNSFEKKQQRNTIF